jgi:hypothetical protein
MRWIAVVVLYGVPEGRAIPVFVHPWLDKMRPDMEIRLIRR